MTKTLAEQYANKCIHFNGVMNKACKAGVDYDTFPTPGPIPCFVDATNAPACALRHFPTQEELQAYLDKMEAHMQRRREDEALIGANHSAGVVSHVYVCEVCDRARRHVAHTSAEITIHLVDVHGIEEVEIRKAQGKMAAHLDARGWSQTDDRFTLDDRPLLTRSARIPRTGSNKAAWADGTAKRSKRR